MTRYWYTERVNNELYQCAVCAIEAARTMLLDRSISVEDFVKIEDRAKFAIYRSKYHLDHVTCGMMCIETAEEILKAHKLEKWLKDRCKNPECQHTIEKHSIGQCAAFRCKCRRFMTEEDVREKIERETDTRTRLAEQITMRNIANTPVGDEGKPKGEIDGVKYDLPVFNFRPDKDEDEDE